MGILKRVLEEVEKIMYEFKGMLYKSLEDPKMDFRNVCHGLIFVSLFLVDAISATNDDTVP